MGKTYTASAIRHLAPSLRGDLVAVALFEKTVSLWDISTGRRVSEFETTLDFGGRRLALSQSESACLTAAYRIHGLACYDTPSGRLRWRRKDLKKIQQVVVTPDGRRAWCCFCEGPCRVISVSTGATIDRIRALRGVWMGPRNGFRLQESRKLEVVGRDSKVAFTIAPDGFAVLDAGISRTHLALSEAGAGVRLFDLHDGREVGRYPQPEDHHVLRLSSTPDDLLFCGILLNYNSGGPKRLLRFRRDSREPEVLREIGVVAETAFCHEGRLLLTSEGDVIDCESGETVRKVPFPQKEYPKD